MSKTPTTDQEALDYHEFPKPGKISVETTKPMATQIGRASCRERVASPV